MLIPSASTLYELRGSRHLVRFVLASDGQRRNIALVVKASSLSLRLIIARKKLSIALYQSPIDNRFVYILRIDEDEREPLFIWSPIESEEEVDAMTAILAGSSFDLHLFNEANVDVCWSRTKSEFSLRLDGIDLGMQASASADSNEFDEDINTTLAELSDGQDRPGILAKFDFIEIEWIELFNHYITNRLASCSISIITGNEGAQQEDIGLWLIDELHPNGAIKNPQVRENDARRELCDLLLTYAGGIILFESKALSVFEREHAPSFARMKRNVFKNCRKAISQLVGATRNIQREREITDHNGAVINIERRVGIHGVVLVPDLSLLEDINDLGGEFLSQLAQASKAFIQFLDIAELNGLASAARHVAELGEVTSPMMAFDAFLFERWKAAQQHVHPNFEFQIRIQDDLEEDFDEDA